MATPSDELTVALTELGEKINHITIIPNGNSKQKTAISRVVLPILEKVTNLFGGLSPRGINMKKKLT